MKIIPVTVLYGDNFSIKSDNYLWYEGPTLLGALDAFVETKQPNLRVSVQDHYKTMSGTVFAGKVLHGAVKLKQKVHFGLGGSYA
jgi:translation elongation factor EF-1alpha